MEPNKFYEHVSNWVKSYRNADALEWLRNFIDNSLQPVEIQNKLHREIDMKVAGLRHLPCFATTASGDNERVLLNEDGHAKVFTTRFSAICKVAELKMKGYSVELKPGDAFYRIKLTQTALIDQDEYAIAS